MRCQELEGVCTANKSEPESHDARCAMFPNADQRFCRNTQEQNTIIEELLEDIKELRGLARERKVELALELRKTKSGVCWSSAECRCHAEIDALTAARKAVSLVGTRLFVTTF